MSMENIAGARKPAKREDEHTVAGEHRMMRRADREVTDPERIAAIIAACDIVEVAYADAEGLTIVPLNFGFDYEYDEATGKLTLWFHSAPRGRKLDAIRAAAGGWPTSGPDRLAAMAAVTVVITSYNQGPLIHEAVESSLAPDGSSGTDYHRERWVR